VGASGQGDKRSRRSHRRDLGLVTLGPLDEEALGDEIRHGFAVCPSAPFLAVSSF